MTLVPEQDVKDFLPQRQIPPAQLAVAMSVVAGWLRKAAGMATPPDGLTTADPLYSAAIELTALVVANPEALLSRTMGPQQQAMPSVKRRAEILAEVQADAQRTASQPAGCFPPAAPWPDQGWPFVGVRSWPG